MDAKVQRRSFVDLIPLFYAAALLHRLDHPSAASSSFISTSVSPIEPSLSMTVCVDLARKAAAGNLVSFVELEASVRAGLHDIILTARKEAMTVGRW